MTIHLDPDCTDPQELRRLIKAEYATGGSPLFPKLHKRAEPPAAPPTPSAPAPAPVLKKVTPAPVPTQEQLLDQVRACLPRALHEWLKGARVDIPLMRSAPFLSLQDPACRLGLTPLVRIEIDEASTAKFAKSLVDMKLGAADLSCSRPQLLKAALESTRWSLALRDTTLLPPARDDAAPGPHRLFRAHPADSMRGFDRNFASFEEAFGWFDRACVSVATLALARREKTNPCKNVSYLACLAA